MTRDYAGLSGTNRSAAVGDASFLAIGHRPATGKLFLDDLPLTRA